MISERVRSPILKSTLIYSFVVMIISILQLFDKIYFYVSKFSDLIYASLLIWMAYGFYIFSQAESSLEHKNEQTEIALGDLDVSNVLKSGAILLLLSSSGYLFNSIFFLLDLMDSVEHSINMFRIINALNVMFFFGISFSFFIIQKVFKLFEMIRRNLFNMGLLLVIGFGLQSVHSLITVIIPIEKMLDASLQPRDQYTVLYTITEFMEVGFLVLIILGMLRLRRAILVLDKVPEDFMNMINQLSYPNMESNGTAKNPTSPQSFQSVNLNYINENSPKTLVEKQIERDEKRKKKMFCISCGLELEHDAEYCPECGEENPYIK